MQRHTEKQGYTQRHKDTPKGIGAHTHRHRCAHKDTVVHAKTQGHTQRHNDIHKDTGTYTKTQWWTQLTKTQWYAQRHIGTHKDMVVLT